MFNAPTTPFPLYLLTNNPFRRRSSTTSTSTASPPSSPPQPTSFLARQPTSHLKCHKCLTDLIPSSCIVSKGFTGRYGKAYLVAPPPPTSILGGDRLSSMSWTSGNLPNTLTHKATPRQLVTGAHTVSDISCRSCGSILGWKYVAAVEETQKYKVGKFILETKRVVKSGNWEGGEGEESKDGIEFDSQDEDECDDLFSGVWTPERAVRRRKNREEDFGRGR